MAGCGSGVKAFEAEAENERLRDLLGIQERLRETTW